MKKILLLILLLSFFAGMAYSQLYFPRILIDKEVQHKNCLITRTFWIVPSPVGFVSNKFSPDYGRTWEKVGMFGQGIKPYFANNPQALQAINNYATVRAIGLAQLLASPVLYGIGMYKAIIYEPPGPPYSPDDKVDGGGLMIAGLFTALTGYMTYYLIARPSLKNSLAAYYAGKENSFQERSLPEVGLGYNAVAQSPMLSLRWTF